MDPQPSYTPSDSPPSGWDLEDDTSEYNYNYEQVSVPADLDEDFDIHLFNQFWGTNALTAPVKALGDSQLVGGDEDLHEFNELWGWDYGSLPFSWESEGTAKGDIGEEDGDV